MKMAGNAAGRKALGAADRRRRAPHGPPVHRRRVAARGSGHDLRACGGTASPRSVDLLGEATVTTAEADRYAERCDEALVELSAGARLDWPEREWLERDSAGPIPRVNLSVKVTALTPLMRPRGARARPRRRRDADATAAAPGARPAAPTCTSTWSRSTRSRRRRISSSSLLAEDEFAAGPSAGIVLQAYLRDSPAQLDTAARLGARAPARARRSSSAWSRAPTGTTRWSRRASTAGARRCSSTSPTATATSRSSRAACSTRARSCG